MIPMCSNLVYGMTLGYPTHGMVLGLKGQGLGLKAMWHGFKVYKYFVVIISFTRTIDALSLCRGC